MPFSFVYNPLTADLDINESASAGAITVPNGGTGSTSFNVNGAVISGTTTTSPLTALTMTDGQVIIGKTGLPPVANTITAGTGISIASGVGTITPSVNFASSTETQTATSTVLAVNPATLNDLLSLYYRSGILSWGGAGSYYTIAGANFTVDRPGTGQIKSKKISWLGGQTIALTVGACNWIYMDSTGTIGKATTRTDALAEDNILLFECLYDSTPVTPVAVTVREDHPVKFDTPVSDWLHDNVGPIIKNLSGGANITLQGTKGVKIVGADVLSDHGLEVAIPDSAGAAVTIKYFYTDAAGKWVQHASQNTCPSVYNNAGVIAALSAGRFGVFRLYVSKDDIESGVPLYFAVISNAQYTSLATARSAISSGVSSATNELYGLELAQLGYIILSQNTDTLVEFQISKSVLRNTTTGSGATNLAGLISTDVSTFNRVLASTDTNVQVALNSIDNRWGSVAKYVQPGAYPYTIVEGVDQYISVDCSAARTIKLPDAPVSLGTGIQPTWTVKDRTMQSGANPITVTTPSAAALIDGINTYTINVNGGCASFLWNGTGYEVF